MNKQSHIIILKMITSLFAIVLGAFSLTACSSSSSSDISIINISYDPTREFYEQYNQLFQNYWYENTGQMVEIIQSHGSSGKQARSVLEGNEADVVTLALENDVNQLSKADMIPENWIDQLPNRSSPYTSTIVFLVRKGNPKNIHDWDDLIKEDVEVIAPNPKSSGGARWNFLAAWAFADQTFNGNEEKNREFVKKLYQNVSVLDTGARGSTITFVENGQGDVLVSWENEAFLSLNKYPDDFEMITPSISILAQPSVAVVEQNVEKHETKEVATAYLEYLYSDEAQKMIAENYYRPTNLEILNQYRDVFDLNVHLVNIDDDFNGWEKANEKFFADQAIFDQIYNDR